MPATRSSNAAHANSAKLDWYVEWENAHAIQSDDTALHPKPSLSGCSRFHVYLRGFHSSRARCPDKTSCGLDVQRKQVLSYFMSPEVLDRVKSVALEIKRDRGGMPSNRQKLLTQALRNRAKEDGDVDAPNNRSTYFESQANAHIKHFMPNEKSIPGSNETPTRRTRGHYWCAHIVYDTAASDDERIKPVYVSSMGSEISLSENLVATQEFTEDESVRQDTTISQSDTDTLDPSFQTGYSLDTSHGSVSSWDTQLPGIRDVFGADELESFHPSNRQQYSQYKSG